MAQAIATLNGTPGAVVAIDPRLVQLMAIDLLDSEQADPEPEPSPQLDPRSFQRSAIGNPDDRVARPTSVPAD